MSLVKFNEDSDKYWLMVVFLGERGSIEQNKNPTLRRLILGGEFFERVLIIFCGIYKVFCWSFLPCALNKTF